MKRVISWIFSAVSGKKAGDQNPAVCEKYADNSKLVALTNQGKSQLEVYDISKGKLDDSSRVWSYKMPIYNIAGTKRRYSAKYGDVALAVCGRSYGCMISYPEGKLLWHTWAAANNPHSIELMPNGVIAIASSYGGRVRFFNPNRKTLRGYAASVPLEDAHGVLWDDDRQVLWAIGRNVLTAYHVELTEKGGVAVTEDHDLRTTIPSNNAHDLVPVYGNKDEIWITTSPHVYRFNKVTGTFSTDYEGKESLDKGSIKGVGNFDDGSIVFIYPDGKFKSWTSQTACFLNAADGMKQEVLRSADGHFYKIRIWDTRYQ